MRDATVKLVDGDAGLGVHPPLFTIDLDDVVHVFREIDDDATVDCLPRKASAATSRQHGNSGSGTRLDGCANVVRVVGHDDTKWSHLVDGGVGRVHLPRVTVEPDFAGDRLF